MNELFNNMLLLSRSIHHQLSITQPIQEQKLLQDLAQTFTNQDYHNRIRNVLHQQQERKQTRRQRRTEEEKKRAQTYTRRNVTFRDINYQQQQIPSISQAVIEVLFNIPTTTTTTEEKKYEEKPLVAFEYKNSDDLHADEKECPICRDDFQENETILHTTCCNGNKRLHIECARRSIAMYTENHNTPLCPFCKSFQITMPNNL